MLRIACYALVMFMLDNVYSRTWPDQHDCSPCECRILRKSTILKNYRVKVANCSARNLTDIPHHLPFDTEELHLNGNNFTESFTTRSYTNLWKYNSVKVVLLQNNHINELPDDMFINVTKLQYLDLSGNRLDTIPPNLFSISSLLVAIRGIDTISIHENLFRGLDKLRYLELTLGKQIQPNLFHQLTLKSVKLHLKSATSLPSALFASSNTTLHEVMVEGDILDTLPGSIFSLLDLRWVYLYLRNARSLPENLFQVRNDIISLHNK